MAITYSGHSESPTLFPLGNGRLLVWEEGASIYSLQNGYSSPHLCSLSPALGGRYYEVETRHLAAHSAICHRLYFSDEILQLPTRQICDLQMIDLLPREEGIFLRRFEGIAGAEFQLSLPPYVRAVYHPSYKLETLRADLLFLTVPCGVAFQRGMVTLREHTVMLILNGALQYDPMQMTIRFLGDQGELCLVQADDPKEAIRKGELLVKAYRQMGDSLEEHPYFEKIFSALADRSYEQSPDLWAGLGAMQSTDGGVIASLREPYAKAADLPALTACWALQKQTARVERMLLRWSLQVEEKGFVPTAISCSEDVLYPGNREEPLSAAAYLWSTAYFARRYRMDPSTAELLYRGMRRAYSTLMQAFREGMLPFGAEMQAFEAGLLGDSLLFQGSAEVTSLAIAAGDEFAAYCRENSKRTAKSEQGYREILESAKAQMDTHFAHGGKICRNAPRLESLIRRPRFLRGICWVCRKEGAYPVEDQLELGKYGQYLCRRCAARHRTAEIDVDPARRHCSPRSTAAVALGKASPTAIGELLLYAADYCNPTRPLPLREADTEPLLLLALRTHRDELLATLTQDPHQWKRLCQMADLSADATLQDVLDRLTEAVAHVIRSVCQQGMLPDLLIGTEPSGSPCRAGSTALALWALEQSN